MGSVSGQAGRTNGPISRTTSYRPNRPAASDPYRAALRQRSLRPVDNSSRPPVFERLRRPAASRPTTRWSAVIVELCGNSDSAYSAYLYEFSLPEPPISLSHGSGGIFPKVPMAIDMLPSLSWLDRAQRLVVMMHCPMWDFLRTFFSFDAQRCWVAGCGLFQSL